ncbi:hypothetical protein ZIOFF_074728 [Zingiber officinale]|uniref:Myb/SANT-like domain-containing protein n=1 Tax=Zingiber officinale TaxID=94328 RepID=A0A8J5ET12_ZINOF|nr:hypothetical protein ZIOFF_074728 [Zingiber officinale]
MDARGKWFKGCLGALYETYININVPANDRLSYVLPGWEVSAADGRVLRDAISRRNVLKIPQGYPSYWSRYKLMKKQFHVINEMLNHNSGFGWSDVENCIITTKDVFDDWVKSHPATIGLRNKEFPHLDDLMFAWGKDRAT